MINRVVLMKLNESADHAVIDTIQSYVARIHRDIKETKAYHFAPNKAADKDGFNWVLHSAFADETDMDSYRSAPLHKEFVDYCDLYTEDFLICFYQAPDE